MLFRSRSIGHDLPFSRAGRRRTRGMALNAKEQRFCRRSVRRSCGGEQAREKNLRRVGGGPFSSHQSGDRKVQAPPARAWGPRLPPVYKKACIANHSPSKTCSQVKAALPTTTKLPQPRSSAFLRRPILRSAFASSGPRNGIKLCTDLRVSLAGLAARP